jgi:hypothetical protein
VVRQLLFIFFAFIRYWKKKWGYSETVHELFIDFKNDSDLVRKKVIHNILIEFGVRLLGLQTVTRSAHICSSFSSSFLSPCPLQSCLYSGAFRITHLNAQVGIAVTHCFSCKITLTANSVHLFWKLWSYSSRYVKELSINSVCNFGQSELATLMQREISPRRTVSTVHFNLTYH